MDHAPQTVRDEAARLGDELAELEAHFSAWSAKNAHDGRMLRSIANRIVRAARSLQSRVSENTYRQDGG